MCFAAKGQDPINIREETFNLRALLCLAICLYCVLGFAQIFAFCDLLAHIQNYKGMLALIARLRFDDLLDDSLAHILARFALFCVSVLALKS